MTETATRRGYADGPFGQVHYRRAGDGRPLILCHESPDSSVMFEPVLGQLAARGFMAVAMDSPGYGLSDPKPGDPDVGDYASALGALLDHLGLASACVGGHHTGALVAADFAWKNPDRVEKLILSAPPVATDQSLAAAQTVKRQLPEVRADGGHLLELWTGRLKYPMAQPNLALAHNAFCRTLAHWPGYFKGSRAAMSYDIRPALQALAMPVLFMCGVHDGLLADLQRARAMRPDFTYAEIDGASGYAIDEQPEAWVSAIADFAS